MPANDRGGLKAAFTNFNNSNTDKNAEIKLLGRTIEEEQGATSPRASIPGSYQVATAPVTVGTLIPRPLLQREAVRQLSFRCPVSTAVELRRKAALNRLEQQEIIIEGIKRVLIDLPDPPTGWEGL
jgi:hypothetical protein